MITHRLWEDSDGDLWLSTDVDYMPGRAPGLVRLLGAPREELYGEVPQALWGQLEGLIEERKEAERFGRDCRDEARETYERGRK